jgi:predicted HNH restriction endonuclease
MRRYGRGGAAAIRRLRARLKAVVNAYRSVPCKDCGNTYPVCCMDFDHVRGKKLGDVATMANHTAPLAKILNEIEKCEVVCSNCHRIRTTRRVREKAIADNPQLFLL